MKWLTYIAGLLGLAAVIAMVVHQDGAAIAGAFNHAGWALLWLLPFHVLPLLLDVVGWRILLAPRDPQRRAGLLVLFWIAAVREACNRLLPVANIGGEIVGIRMAKWYGIDGAAVTASIVIEVLLTLINQYLFTALGIVLLIALTQQIGTLDSVLWALVASLPLPVGLFMLLRHGQMFSRLEAVAEKLLGGRTRLTELINGKNLDQDIRTLCASPLRLVGAGAWQFAGFLVGSFETWLALEMLGYPVSIWDAIAIEAVTQALRHIVFIVPAGLGVQEGGMILFGSMIGVPPDASLVLSLAKRLREVGFGVPALLSWQWAEMRRLRAGWQNNSISKLCDTTRTSVENE
ncbi:lysylphosphatidylglycerol synthase domain-containing protein [Azomonas macrocytogenes]|uniref:Putative membrane protein n=1 Tax=Azomonas macrocytogenes TaxID=69962 RepID=A0A839T5B3_AZOMA|nr:lysylphosphatidylglycerol synthase domain-containing protein [Azomonas macrocytogenes]MBB3104717.1 putative membrane protein [Azomonas macrocytogenes]